MDSSGFLSRSRLLLGPWKAFERDVARLLLQNGFTNVRLVGGSGDRGADVLGVKGGELWVFQCKHTTGSPPPLTGISEVAEAGRAYKADRLVIAVSRQTSDGFHEELLRYKRQGLDVEVASPELLLGLMDASPEYSPLRRMLHQYQEETAAAFRRALTDTGRAQIVLATGLGKTIVMAEVVADLLRDNLIAHGRTLVLAHTNELVDQLHQAFWYQLPKWVATQQLAKGERPTYWDGITFATIQTAISQVETLPSFGLVLVDEAHHVGADSFRRVLDELKAPMVGGVTATPWRGDNFDIDTVLGRPVAQVGIADGLRKGFLTEVDYRLCADDIDWNVVQDASRYKYSLSQLNRRLLIPTRDEEAGRAIRETFEAMKRRAGVVFCPSIAHANAMAAVLRRYGFRSEAITGSLDPREREVLMSRFREGDLDIVTSVDLFNEGLDVPDIDMIVFMRATHSRRIFVQQLGRGLRVSPGKDTVVVLDFVTDLRRIAEVSELDRAIRDGPIERLGLGSRLISFRNASAGNFMREWMLDQASLFLREGESELELPTFEFPPPPPPGGVQ